MITSGELEAAQQALEAAATSVETSVAELAAGRLAVGVRVAASRAMWGGPLPSLISDGAERYLDGVPTSAVEPVAGLLRRWATAAGEVAHDVRLLEAQRDQARAEQWWYTTLSAIAPDEDRATHRAKRDRAGAEATAAEIAIEFAHAEWTARSQAFAAELDTYTVVVAVQAALTAAEQMAQAAAGSAVIGSPAVAAWLASLPIPALQQFLTSPELASAWWGALSHDQRVQYAAANVDTVTGPLAEVIEQWKGDLDPPQLREYYEAVALAGAGIDETTWDPSRGFDANRENIFAVYDYYSSLYLEDPDTYWWAGMASMIGPSFVAGMADLNDFAAMSAAVRNFAGVAKHVPASPGQTAAGIVAELSAEDLRREFAFYETSLLAMQREIFFDMAVAHEAYRDGGMDAIERLFADDPYLQGAQAIAAWEAIDRGRRTGDQAAIAQGNAELLWREQHDVIEDDYRGMYERPVTGPVMTYLMTAIGGPSIPGAGSFPEVFPAELSAAVGTDDGWLSPAIDPLSPVEAEVEVTIGTPLPDGNVSNFEDRWALIEQDTLPAYETLLTEDAERAGEILSTPVSERYGDYRLVHQLDDFVTNWEVDVDVSVRLDDSLIRSGVEGVGRGLGYVFDHVFGSGGGGPALPPVAGTTTSTLPPPPPGAEPGPTPAPSGSEGPPSAATTTTTTVPAGDGG